MSDFNSGQTFCNGLLMPDFNSGILIQAKLFAIDTLMSDPILILAKLFAMDINARF